MGMISACRGRGWLTHSILCKIIIRYLLGSGDDVSLLSRRLKFSKPVIIIDSCIK